MNQDLTKQLAEWQAQAAELAAKIADAQEALAKPTPRGRWEPADGGSYYFVHTTGGVGADVWTGEVSHRNRFWMGNVRQTYEAAERHAKRIRSMVPTCPVPKMGETFWEVCTGREGFYIYSGEWTGTKGGLVMYLSGRVFASKEAAKAWIAKFADAWTTLEDAS